MRDDSKEYEEENLDPTRKSLEKDFERAAEAAEEADALS